MQYPYAHHTGSDWRSICERIVADIGQAPPPGDLAFIFLDHNLTGDCDRIIDFLRHRTNVKHWVGSVGMGLCSTGCETYDEAAVAVMLTDVPDDELRIIPPLDQNTAEFLQATAPWRERTLASVAVVHGDPGKPNTPEVLEELAEGLQGGFLSGGITSSDSLQVQIADHAVGGGVSGVLFSGMVPIQVGVAQGCTPIGPRHRITECKQNILVTLDGRPALDVFKEEIGQELAGDLHQVGGLIYAAIPVAGSDTGDYMVRNLMGIDPDQGLLAIGQVVAVDGEVQFTRRDPESAATDLVQMLEGIKARLPGAPKGALYHSCLGRGQNLFGPDSAEMKILQTELGDLPVIGFYANGEISHNRLYGYTGALTVFC